METQNNTIFYTHHHQRPSSALGNLYLHPHNDSHELEHVFINTKITTTAAKEPIFQKTLTPSDVGKLNRLVLPKRHAEKYFPLLLRVGGTTDQQKGLFLTFEDEFGKLWRFWYWKSSKSYVLTKGWNQYVHEKRLEAGDHIFFERYGLDSNCKRIFIGWRRQSAAVAPINDRMAEEMAQPITEISRSSYMFHHALSCYPSHHWPISISLPYQTDPSGADAGDENENVVNYKTGVGATRRLRLFGVDLECPNDSESYSGQSDHQYRLRLQQSPSRQG